MKLTPIFIVLLMTIFSGLLSAKQNTKQNNQREFVDQYNKRFEKQKPSIGDSVLDGVVAFDELGKPFPLARLKGKHSVIVFGCLT
jgi:cytochrome oxidase Cu insertion factor (SCO1/SenC/PrrC family)